MSNGGPIVVVVIDLRNGEIKNINPEPEEIKDDPPDGEIIYEMRWDHKSPGCFYIKHGGVWKKVCS